MIDQVLGQLRAKISQLEGEVIAAHTEHKRICSDLRTSMEKYKDMASRLKRTVDAMVPGETPQAEIDAAKSFMYDCGEEKRRGLSLASEHEAIVERHASKVRELEQHIEQHDARVRELQAQKSTDGERVRHREDDTTLNIGRGFDVSSGQFTTDIHIYNRDPQVRTHLHTALTEDEGDELFTRERQDKSPGRY